MSTLIVGCGYLGRRVGRLLARRGEPVWGTVRSQARAAELAAEGIEPVLADVLDPGSLAGLPQADRVLYCVGFDRGSGAPLRAVAVAGLRDLLMRLPGTVGRLVYAGTTGVYGQEDGGWVDEESPAEPRHESGRVALEAEGVVQAFAAERRLTAVVVRFAGLYGPGRIIRRAALAAGEAIAGDPRGFLNLIHIDDAATAAVAALGRDRPGPLYLAGDDRPVRRCEYYERAAELLGAPRPRFEPLAAGDRANRRVANRRIKAELDLTLAYPDIQTGLPAALAAERAADAGTIAAG